MAVRQRIARFVYILFRKDIMPPLGVAVAVSYGLIGLCTIWDVGLTSTSPWAVRAFWFLFMLRTFSFHFGFAFFPMLAVALRRRQWRWVAACSLLIGLHTSWWLPGYFEEAPRPIVGEPVRVMSANLLAGNDDVAAFLHSVSQDDPDILLLQEYTLEWHHALEAALGEQYRYRATAERADAYGMAIYSKLPYVGEPENYLKLGRGSFPKMRAVVWVNNRATAVYNLHFIPPRSPGYIDENRYLFTDLIAAFKKDRLPKIVGGDFNFTEMSLFHKRLRAAGFTDTHERAGLGRAATWLNIGPLRYLPGFRLDHLYVSPELTAHEPHLGVGNASDHFPIVATIGFSN